MADSSHRTSHLQSIFNPDQDFQESKKDEIDYGGNKDQKLHIYLVE